MISNYLSRPEKIGAKKLSVKKTSKVRSRVALTRLENDGNRAETSREVGKRKRVPVETGEIFDIDKSDAPGFRLENLPDIVSAHMKELFKKEKREKVDLNTITRKQPYVSNKDIALVINYLVRVHYELNVPQRSLFLTERLIRKVLEKTKVGKKTFKLIGAVCLFLALKMESNFDVLPSEIEDLLITVGLIAEEDRGEIATQDVRIYSLLDFNIYFVTSYDFLARFSLAAGYAGLEYISKNRKKVVESVRSVAEYYLEVGFLSSKFSSFLVSTQAAAAVFLSKLTHKRNFKFDRDPIESEWDYNLLWDTTARHYTRKTLEDLEEPVKSLHKAVKTLHKLPLRGKSNVIYPVNIRIKYVNKASKGQGNLKVVDRLNF